MDTPLTEDTLFKSAEIQTVRRRGGYSRLETLLRKRLFARTVLSEPHLTKDEICRRVGIGTKTYSKWVRDKGLLREVGQDGDVVTEQTRHFAYQHRGRALNTLLDVMDNSRNDLARVRAAELLLQLGETAANVDRLDVTDHGQDISFFLSQQGPTFVQIVNGERYVPSRTSEEMAETMIESTAEEV